MNYFLKVFTDPNTTATGLSNERAIKKVQELYDGRGRGAELASSKDTALVCLIPLQNMSITNDVQNRLTTDLTRLGLDKVGL